MGHLLRRSLTGTLAAALLGYPALVQAQVDGAIVTAQPDSAGVVDVQDLSRLSLEELSMVEVTSVSRRPEALARAAAAIFVISADDIRRSGAASLPEVLRLAPNLNVQRINAVDYAISARGFNGFETSNKLLVLIDGRSIYSTLSSGVFWDARDLMLDNIERIEIISGPGGALYGSNAMNGVINIISKPTADTVGTLVTAGLGNEDVTLGLRHGGQLGSQGAWRAYLSGFTRDDSFRLTGEDATDAAHGMRGGARLDWSVDDNQLTLQGDAYDNTVALNEDFSGTDTRISGGNVLARLSRPFAGGDFQVQAYYDRFERSEPGALETTDTFDLAVQQAFTLGRHQLVVGAGHRVVESDFQPEPGAPFLNPARRTLTLTNLFLQDQIALTTGVTLTLGAKFEENSFSGQEWLPNIRLAWERPGGDLLWGAISRASRTPNRIERDLTLPGFLVGGTFESETVTAYEAGYRANPLPNASFSISAFYNVYEDLRTASSTPVTFFPFMLTNFGAGDAYGLEAWGAYDITPRWRVSAGLATLNKDFAADPAGLDISGLASVGDDPAYQVQLRSQSTLTDSLELDVRLRAVDDLASTDAFVEADVRLGWRVTPSLELALVGQNLINDHRVENGDPARARAFGRSIYATLRADF